MHRLFTVTALIITAGLISASADARPIEVRELTVKAPAGTPGTAVEPKHKDWINLNKVTLIRWAPGVESRNVKVRGLIPAPGTGQASGLPTGKRQHKPFVVTKPVDKATPLLARVAKSGQPLRGVVMVLRTPNGRPQMIKMKPVYITSYQTGSSAGDTVPMEQISLNYEK